MTVLDASAIASWRREPIRFIEQVLRDPETGRPFELFEAQRQFFEHAWTFGANGRLLYPEQCFGAPKKSGKTGTAAMHVLTTTCLYGGRFAESFCLANDEEQAQGRVFQAVRRIVEASPHLRRDADITQTRITFPQTGAVIQAIGNDYASAAGANPVISSFDELWAFTSERSRRLWDEMIPSPARKVSARLVTTYAGFENEGELLFDLYKRGLQQQQIGPSLYAGNGLLMAWHHKQLAPWQDEAWLAEARRTLRPNQYLRMIECRFVTTEASFIDMALWDRCVDPAIGSVAENRSLPIFVGIDASVKRDSTAVVATAWDRKAKAVRLVFHRVFQPTPDQPLDFESTVEATVLDLKKRFCLYKCIFDPYQMEATAQRLRRAGVAIEEFPQSLPNLTQCCQNLYDLIQGGNLICYPDAAMRLAISRAVAVEGPRGWRLGKDKQTHKIDVVVALAMSALLAMRDHRRANYISMNWVSGPDEDSERDPDGAGAWRAMRLAAHIARYG